MTEPRGRRPRRRRKACVEEVLPSTDLPPLVQGDLRCFLVVDIGKIVWSSTATAQVPPASPAYIRLRWWGESSQGTVFKPSYAKSNEKPVKCRCRFGVRSGAKQMSAYFVDMASIVFELLTSPKSVPLGRIQVPKVAHLTSSNPIRDYFPIVSPSSRKIGEIEIHIRFKSLEAAYDLTTDTGTDTSISSRSRPASEIGKRSRSRGSSIGSKASARSRSSSTGSRRNGQKKRSGSKKSRRRSVSTESNASSASKRSHSIRRGSTISSSTPRGIDDILEINGQDLFSIEQKLPKKSNLKSNEKKAGESKDTQLGVRQDAISILLQKGTRLKEDIVRSQMVENKPMDLQVKPQISQPNALMKPVESTGNPQIMPSKAVVHDSVTSNPRFLECPKMVGPIKEKTQEMDMRFVDLVFGSQEFTGGGLSFWNEMDSHVGSPLSSMISELDDNPMYDESLLQQMFYNNKGLFSFYAKANKDRNRISPSDITSTDSMEATDENVEKILHGDRLVRYLTKHITGLTKEKIANLQRVYCVGVTIETLTVYDMLINKARAKKGRGRGGKPPVPSPKKAKTGAYFVEFQFPEVSQPEKRDHPSTMKTTHDVTRVVSRKMQPSRATIAIFDESYEFPYKFTDENLLKWNKESMEFTVYQRKSSDKKAFVLGTVKLPLRDLLSSAEEDHDFDLDVQDGSKTIGSLKAIFKFHVRPDRSVLDIDKTRVLCEKENQEQDMKNGSTDNNVPVDDAMTPSIVIGPPANVLNMLVMVAEGISIPGTAVTNPQSGTKIYPPNLSLVCRTLSPGECDKTPVIWGQNNPKFDFVQVIPVNVDDTMLVKMKNNFVIIEVWAKITVTTPPSEKLLGLAKLPTHHFYQSLKDEEISKVVLNSMHPIISVDEPVPVTDLFTGQERGHLQVTLALGTQTQITNLRKVKSEIQGKNLRRDHHLKQRKDDLPENVAGFVQHTFELNVVKLHNFRPPNNELWGEAECFVQYMFPTQQRSEKDDSIDMNSNSVLSELAVMESYGSETTLLTPESAFNHARHHKFAPPPSVPIQRILLSCCYSQGMPGGIPFELWSRYYHPNVRDKLLAKGTLPMAKVGSLVTMSHSKLSQQSFHVPMFFTDSDTAQRSAGTLEVAMKYKASGTTSEMLQPPMKFSKPVILRVSLFKACGLKEAASLACRHGNDDNLKQCLEVGVNTYVEMKPTFLADEDVRTSRIVACSFTPEYQHHVEIACPLISYHRDVTPISLAELLLSGEMEINIWHRCEDGDADGRSDICLAKLNLPMRNLLHKYTGVHGWHSMHSEHSRDEVSSVAGLEMSVSFANSNDLDIILNAAKATKWQLPPFETRILNNDVKNYDITGSDCVTFSVTVTNAWLPKDDLLLRGRTSIDKFANVYVRYKFFDHDSVVTTPCTLPSKQPHSIDTRFENLTSARIAHKKSFVCKRSRPLHWYLREEKMEIQIWLTHSIVSKQSRPSDADKLLGSCFVEFSSMSEWQKEQHISGSFPMFKAGADTLGGQVRVYVSMRPGELPDPIPDPMPESTTSTETENLKKIPIPQKIPLTPPPSTHTFDATVTVERAFHLPHVNDVETDKPVFPNVFVSFEVVDVACPPKTEEDIKIVTMTSRIVTSSENVTWNDIKTVSLPKSLLTGSHGGMIIKVWHRDRLYIDIADSKNSEPVSIGATDRMLGFATVDLSVLRAGFRDVNGWYNIMDIHGQCQGQLKVAVTPTRSYDSSLPNSARSTDMSITLPCPALPLISIPPNFLHKVPIDIPVQTPSGSMYVPGVQRSVDVDNKACVSTVSTCPEQYAGRFHADFCHIDNMPVAPNASVFRYQTSDQQQANLVYTLEKQINELELIKKRFEERKRTRFQDSVRHDGEISRSVENALSSLSITKNAESSLEGSHAKPSSAENFESEDGKVAADVSHCKNSDDSQQSSSRSNQPEEHMNGDSVSRNSIHLSLYQSRKIANLDDRALSDNDVDSDIEFIQPQSLNESVNIDGNKEATDPNDKIIKKPPHVTPSHSAANIDKLTPTHFESPGLCDVITPNRSEGHSALDDTSLWLTGSTLRESGVISDDENAERVDDVDTVSKQVLQDDDQERESVQSGTPRSVVTPLDEEIHENDEIETVTADNSENPVIHDEQPFENVDTEKKRDDNNDCTDERHKILHSSSITTNQIDIKDHSSVKETARPNPEVLIEPGLVEPSSDIATFKNDVVSDQDNQNVGNAEVAASFSECEQNGFADDSATDESLVMSRNDENLCPNCKTPELSSKQKQRDVVTSFYPPSRNIQASIREIQEAALAHKSHLGKIKKRSNDSEQDQHQNTQKKSNRSMKTKSKKAIPSTVHYSDERTQRLARIFRTKFSQ